MGEAGDMDVRGQYVSQFIQSTEGWMSAMGKVITPRVDWGWIVPFRPSQAYWPYFKAEYRP